MRLRPGTKVGEFALLVSFKYDPFGRRIYKSSSSGTSVFAYDGDNLVEETNAGGTAWPAADGLNIDEPLAMLKNGLAVGNIAYPSLPAAIDAWEKNFGDRVRGDADPGDFVHDLQHPDPPDKPYNSMNPNYEDDFEQVYNAVLKFMKLCGIKP